MENNAGNRGRPRFLILSDLMFVVQCATAIRQGRVSKAMAGHRRIG